MASEDLDDLLKIPASTRADAEIILFELEAWSDGLNTTTAILADNVLSVSGQKNLEYLFGLDFALRALAEHHGLLLDSRHHDGLVEGLPFNLDFYVWHRNNAAVNGMFGGPRKPKRDYRDEFDDMIAGEIGKILENALPAEAVPQSLRFSHRNEPACDAELLGISCSFEIAEFEFELGFGLDTGQGGMMRKGDPFPEPHSYNVSLRCEGMDGNGDDVCYLWDEYSSKWGRCEED